MQRVKCPVLVGRDTETGLLRAATQRAVDGRGGTVVLSGEPGVGKSRAVAALQSDAEEHGLVVLSGRAVRASTPTPLRPLSEALLAWLRRNELPASTRMDPFRPSLARLAPQLWDGRAGEQATSLVLLGEALLRLAAAAGEGRGCLLVLEDLHWADPETLAVFEYVADNVADVPLLVVATTRPGESAATQQLVDALVTRGSAERLDLTVLDAAATDAMVAACLGGDVPSEVRQFVTANAEGVPLLVEELLTGMQAAGALVAAPDGTWQVAGPITAAVPETFARTVQLRLQTQEPVVQQVARAAAVLGSDFDWTPLPAALELDDASVLQALRTLVDQQIVAAREQSFAFRHALTREAVLAALLPPERAELARRLAEACARPDADVDQQTLAELFDLAGDAERSAGAWHTAAVDALGKGALATALEMVGRAGDLVEPDSETGLAVRQTLLEVHALAGDSPAALRVGESLVADLERSGAAADRLAPVRLRLARAAYAGGLWDEAADLLAPIDGVDPAGTAVLRAGVALGRLQPDQAVAEAQVALAAAGERADVACEAWEVIGRAARGRDVLQAEEAFEEAYRIAEQHGLGHWRARILQQLGSLDLVGRRPTEDRLLAARAAALEAGSLATAAIVDLQLNLLRIRYLDLERAMAAADAAIALMTRLRLPALGSAYLIRAMTHGLAGRPEEMEVDLAAGLRTAPDDPELIAGKDAHVRGPVALARGRYDEARAAFAAGMEVYRLHPGLAFSMRGLWALLETVHGDGAAARDEVRDGPQITSPHNWFALRYADAVALGREGRAEEAEQTFADATWTHPGPEPWMEVHMRGLVARAAAADGWGEPELWFRQTLDGLVEAGQTEAASACRAAMRDAGIAVPRKAAGARPVPNHLQHLGVTAREYDVLELVAQGLTNQAIAERLFLSTRTVETHVARLLQRTGSGGRGQLATYVAPPSAGGRDVTAI
ncbi:hypothetical protein GCM10023146_34420 [Nocardioides caricicola]